MTENDKTPVKRSRRLEERRLQIIEAAAALFIKQGFHQTGMRDIAQQAGISLGNLYNHFKGKSDIIAAISELETSDLEPLLQPIEQGKYGDEAVFFKFARDYFELYATPAYAALTAEITAEVFRNPQIAAEFLPTRKRLISAVERYLSDDLTDRSVTAGLVIDLIERAGQSAVGQSRKTKSTILSAMFEFLKRVV